MPNCNCKKSCDRDCDRSCEQNCLIKKCELPRCVIKAQKTILNVAFLLENGEGLDDFCATFEIVIFNETCNRIKNICIIDSLMGLTIESGFTGGELRPHFTNVEITGCHPTFTPYNFDQIAANGGQLVDPSTSYLDPCEVAVLRVRLAGRGYLIGQDPTTGEPGPVEGAIPKYTALMQNTAIIRGNVAISQSETIPMYPVYIKSGMIAGMSTQVLNFFEGPP